MYEEIILLFSIYNMASLMIIMEKHKPSELCTDRAKAKARIARVFKQKLEAIFCLLVEIFCEIKENIGRYYKEKFALLRNFMKLRN